MQDQLESIKFIAPVVLRPRLTERVWGVEELPAWYPQPEPGHPVGEAWLTPDDCPLLVKMLFPAQKLSVQVHPNDAQAQALGQPRGKTECWYVVSAQPGATVAVGFREPMTVEQVRAAIADATLEAKLLQLPVKEGDLVYVEAGTVHAIGPGVVLLETQQYSDITYRLWDYGRPRELHVEQGLAVTNPLASAGITPAVAMDGFTRLIHSPYFIVDRFQVAGSAPLGELGTMQLLVALGEGVTLAGPAGSTSLPPGWAVMVPPAPGAFTLRADGTEVIRIVEPAK